MLGLNGGVRLWYIEGINNMRYGKYRLFCELEASKVLTSLSDMERLDYEAQIRDLKETNKRLLEMIKTLQLTLESVNASNRRNEELVKNLMKQVSDLQKMIADLEDRNRRHNKNTYGKKSHKAKKSVVDKPSREEEKDNYDGSHGCSKNCHSAL